MDNLLGKSSDAGDRAVRVLLAEDEFLIRLDVAETLRDLGWHVFEVSTADEGIAIIDGGTQIDLLLSDINMPGERDGSDLARAVRSKLPGAKIVLMSGLVRARALPDQLFDLFMPKPVLDLQTALLTLMASQVPTR